ncbi:MAG: WbqC family protein [Bacteroidales bacterium]|nr:WbqC family protein [Bacteroidales bacterium]
MVPVLTIAYFPPVEYFALLAKYSSVYVEACENYQKQSYRNRCRIYAENGVQNLNFPVRHRDGTFNLPIREIEVDYSTPWVAKTERCIETAYRSSAFFEYYRDELFAILDSQPRTLWELDMQIIRFFVARTGLKTELVPTERFADAHVDIHPKRPNAILREEGLERPYYQVFSERFGFIPNLSVMDLLFNEGPASLDYLR